MNDEEFFEHYGIKGMHWGHKKAKQITTKLEKANKNDLEEINHLFNKLSTSDRKFLVLDQKLQLIRKNIKDERHCFVSKSNGKIVGFIRESGRPKGFNLLEELVVDPDYRNKGVASKMLDEFNSRFPKTLAKSKANNQEINTLLAKKGYKPDNPEAKSVINWSRQTSNTEKNKQTVEKLLNDMSKEEDQKDVKHGGGNMNDEEFFEHYGIKGMHWGKRGAHRTVATTEYGTRDKSFLEKQIQKSKDRRIEKEKSLSEDHKKKMEIKKKKINQMSNAELKTINERLQLERQYRSLSKEDLSPGRRFVKEVLHNNAKQTSNTYASKYMGKSVEALIKNATGG